MSFPREVLVEIFRHAEPLEVIRAYSLVSKSWKEAIDSIELWRWFCGGVAFNEPLSAEDVSTPLAEWKQSVFWPSMFSGFCTLYLQYLRIEH